MKKTTIIALLALLGFSQGMAQDYEYVPFVREGVKWVYNNNNPFSTAFNIPEGTRYYTFEMQGDTVIGGKHYKPVLLRSYNYDGSEDAPVVPVYVREQDKVVYAYRPAGAWYPQCPVGFFSCVTDTGESAPVFDQEFVLYDFNDPESLYKEFPEVCYNYTDMVTVGARQVKCHHYTSELNSIGDHAIIEGLGYVTEDGMPLFYFVLQITGFQMNYSLSHVIENGEIAYTTGAYTDDMYTPLNREGVKWVNERVIVNNGQQTKYYYTYEFKGQHPDASQYTACYYYRSRGNHTLDVDTDSLIAGLNDIDGYVRSRANHPLDEVINQDRNMMNFTAGLDNAMCIYNSLGNEGLAGWYFESQRTPLLNADNFFILDTIVVDNCKCTRWAYLNEQGEPLCYIVEGIGFDSRDMGDMLTPFTRVNEGDYQEYCGLSHVIKNGTIIYKGMRYDEESIITGIAEPVVDTPADGKRGFNRYYDLMGRDCGTDVPTMPGIYVHEGKKIVVR